MTKSIHTLFEEFMCEREFVQRIRSSTLRSYREAFRTLHRLCPGTELESINTSLITRFFKTLQERRRVVGKGIVKVGVKNSTIGTYAAKMSTFFTWLESRGHIQENPLRVVPIPRTEYSDLKFLKRDQLEKILTAIHMHSHGTLLRIRNFVIYYLLLFCGLRKGELLGLQVRDIDLDARLLLVRSESSKSKTSRQIPIHPILLQHLKEYLHLRRHHNTQYLLVSYQRTGHLSEGGLDHLVKRLSKASRVDFHLHQFRHTFAVNFLKHTNNVMKLKHLLGHKDIKMTTVYLRCLPVEHMRGDLAGMNIDGFF